MINAKSARRAGLRPSGPLPGLTTTATPDGQKHHEHDEYDHERLDKLIGSHHAFSWLLAARDPSLGSPLLAPVTTRRPTRSG